MTLLRRKWARAGAESASGVVVLGPGVGCRKFRPQQVDLVLTVAPEGWTPTAYKEGRIVQFTGDGDESMTVVLLDDLSPDLAGYGATD